MNFFHIFVFSTLFFSMSSSADSQSLGDLIKKALQQSDSLKVSEQNLKRSQAQTEKAKSLIFPTLNATASVGNRKVASTSSSAASNFSGSSKTSDVYSLGLELNQPLYVGGAVTSGLALAHINEEISSQSFLTEKQKVVVNVVTAFYELIEKNLKIQEAVSNSDVLQSYLEITKRYERIGRARNTDRLLAEMNYSDSQIELQNYKDEKRISENNLKRLVGVPHNEPIQVKTELNTPLISKLDLDQAIDMAIKNNPEIKASALSVEAIEQSRTIDLSQDMPSVNLVGSYGYSAADSPSLLEETSNSYSVLLNLKVPLFSGLSSFSKRAEYSAQRVGAEGKSRDLTANISNQVRTLIETIETQKEIIKMQEKNLAESSKALQIILKSYQNGTASSNDVVSIQRSRYDAGKRFISYQISYLKTVLTLRQILGTDLEKVYAQNN